MPAIETDLTRLLGCRVPLISAPMAGVSFVELAIAVSAAGGFGFIAKGHEPLELERLSDEFEQARRELGTGSNEVVPIGVGFIAWRLDMMAPKDAYDYVAAVVANVKCVWVSFGSDLRKWIKLIRQVQKENRRCKVAVVVSSFAEAENLLSLEGSQTLDVDIVVGQGYEAGGHASAHGETINALVPMLKALLIKLWPEATRPVLVAAGGLTHGAHLAAILALGASGMVCGTRFLATPQSRYTDAQKCAILAARSVDTIKTTVFDELRGTVGWPKGIDGRALKNDTMTDHLSGIGIEDLRTKYKVAMKTGDVTRLVTWAGTSVGLVTEVMSVKEVVQEIEEEAISVIMATHARIQK